MAEASSLQSGASHLRPARPNGPAAPRQAARLPQKLSHTCGGFLPR